jgi:hypothetical protein
MKWNKKGLIFDPQVLSWAEHSALQPTPLLLSDRIRVFFGARDLDGVSRIGYVDLARDNVSEVIGWSEAPILDIGEDGCFDENGVVPSAVVKRGDTIFMYYAGYQLGTKVRFLVLGGLAISKDDGKTFQRFQNTPVFERNHTETLFRVPHTVIVENDIWKVWYGAGNKFVKGEAKTLPIYDIRYVESKDPYSFPHPGKVILETQGNEYRLGRPYLYKKADREFYLFYGYSSENVPYQLGCAFSSDLKEWKRIDSEIGIGLSENGWDSEMMAYPSVFEINGAIYMLYNGNEYGKYGFGLAELQAW